jgi:intracellular septation protein A
MFVVNAAAGIDNGTRALIVSTIIAMAVMRIVLGRFPVFPIIASSVTIAFGVLTLVTGDPMWVQIKVSIFNALFAGFLFGGLFMTSPKLGRYSLLTVLVLFAIGTALQAPLVTKAMASHWPMFGDHDNPLFANMLCLGSLLAGFVVGTFFKRNFFGYVFEKTFHYTQEGWDRFTYSFAWFFVFTAFLNEVVRQVFAAETFYAVPMLGEMNGVNIWILFKIAFIMPLSGVYAWYLTRLMQAYRIDTDAARTTVSANGEAAGGQGYVLAPARSSAQRPKSS